MAQLIYSAICSLDGYVADENGDFGWAAPDAEVHAFVNELERPIGTYLYGRGMYETMVVWETMDTTTEPAVIGEFAALWRTADKVVYSRTLVDVGSARTRLEREFEPAAVQELVESAERDVGIGGAGLGGQALAAGLVGEVHLILAPVLVGAGTRALPDGVHRQLELLEQRSFANGMVHLRYRTGNLS
jgi:dihydrofolate reductase